MALKPFEQFSENFTRAARRWLWEKRHVRGKFFTAVADGDYRFAQEVLDLFPEAVRWTGGDTGGNGIWRDTLPLATALYSVTKDWSDNAFSTTRALQNANPLSLMPALSPRKKTEGGLGIVRLLLERGAEVNGQDKYGNTALHRAVNMVMRRNVIEALILQGADPDLPGFGGETPRGDAQKIMADPYRRKPAIDLCTAINDAEKARRWKLVESIVNAEPVKVSPMPRIRLKKSGFTPS